MKKILYSLLSLLFAIALVGCTAQETPSKEQQPNQSQETPSKEQQTNQTQEQNSGDKTQTPTSQSSDHKPQGKTMDVSIVRVIDGDTVKVKLPNGNEETVRLLLIDTPETVHPSKPVQPFGKEASNLVKELLPANSKATLEIDVSERDKYGRLLGYIWVNGKMVNEILLEKGYARVAYVYAPNTRWVDYFREIQSKAQQKELGIWSIENYATDKGFNEDVKAPSTSNN
ncbi:MAG: thermonuclease family protein, partial [Bacillaceae bacterium]